MSDEIITGMLAFQEALKRERKMKLLVLVINILLVLGLLYLAVFMQNPLASIVFTLAGIGFGVAVFFGRDIWKNWEVNHSPIISRLHQNPTTIVWLYTIRVDFSPFGIQFWDEYTLSFRLDDGEELQIRIRATEIIKIEKALRKMLPQATFGYSKEREQWYMANPMLLLNIEED